MKLTRRAILVIAPTAVLSGCSLSSEDGGEDDSESLVDGPLTLVQIQRNTSGEAMGLVHLRIDPADDGDNTLTAWLTDLQGTGMAAPVTAIATNLTDGTIIDPVPLAEGDTGWSADIDLAPEGWWQFDVGVDRDGEPTVTRFYALLPDPNIHGTGHAPSPDESADARALFDRAITTMEAEPHLRWIESINTGNDTIVTIDYTLMAETASAPPAVEQFLRYSATFVERADGSAPPAPQIDSYHAITIGEEGWVLTQAGAATSPPGNYAPIADWGSIYAAAEHIALGITAEIGGEPMQTLSFYSPEYNGQAQAWFVWWVGTESGRVHRIGMLARAHYMTWDYMDFDTDVTIARPEVPDATPTANPVS